MRGKDINYRKEAFLHPWNLIFLSGALAAAFMVPLIPGLLAGLFETVLLFTAAAELLIIGWLPNQKRFRNIVKARRAKERARPPTPRELYSELSRDNQRRYVKLRDLQRKTEINCQKFSYASQGLLESNMKKIDGLINSCLSMMHQQESYRLYCSSVKEKEVLDDIIQLRKDTDGSPESVRSIQLRRLKILEQRLARFKKRQEHLEVLNEQIETIEDVVNYIHEQSLTLQNPEQIALQLDVLMSDVEETEASLGPIESAFGEGTYAEFNVPDSLTAYEKPLESHAQPDQRARTQ